MVEKISFNVNKIDPVAGWEMFLSRDEIDEIIRNTNALENSLRDQKAFEMVLEKSGKNFSRSFTLPTYSNYKFKKTQTVSYGNPGTFGYVTPIYDLTEKQEKNLIESVMPEKANAYIKGGKNISRNEKGFRQVSMALGFWKINQRTFEKLCELEKEV